MRGSLIIKYHGLIYSCQIIEFSPVSVYKQINTGEYYVYESPCHSVYKSCSHCQICATLCDVLCMQGATSHYIRHMETAGRSYSMGLYKWGRLIACSLFTCAVVKPWWFTTGYFKRTYSTVLHFTLLYHITHTQIMRVEYICCAQQFCLFHPHQQTQKSLCERTPFLIYF